jgi:rhamnulose-1-phosphate aldolase
MPHARPEKTVRISDIITQLGDAGQRLTEIDACEGAAGNLSVYIKGRVEMLPAFKHSEIVELPLVVPELARGCFVVTGSGTRLREIGKNPGACLGCIEVSDDGKTGTLYYSDERRFARITSEFNSHMAVHRDHVAKKDLEFHAVVHGQPRKMTYLSHLEAFQESESLNRRLLRWQPEAILNFPEGIAVVPFLVPGQRELMLATERALHDARVVIWSKHGVLARSHISVQSAVDLIEYLETAATYECLDRLLGGSAVGLSPEQMRSISRAYGVEQTLF